MDPLARHVLKADRLDHLRAIRHRYHRCRHRRQAQVRLLRQDEGWEKHVRCAVLLAAV